MKHTIIMPFAAMLLVVASCATPPKVSYFQDSSYTTVESPDKFETKIKLKPGDKISIIVTCADQRLTNLLNLPYVTQRLGSSSSESTHGVSGYTLDSSGFVDFPQLGMIDLNDLTREQCSDKIKQLIIDSQLAKDPIVTVDYMNLSVAVLGEVSRPGRYFFDKDNFTLMDALSMAGDLTINGQRENVQVMREEKGMQKTYTVDLTSIASVVSSPVYTLQQNDVVYVEPNDVRKRQSTVNGNNVRSTSFWMSLASLASTLTLTIINIAGRL